MSGRAAGDDDDRLAPDSLRTRDVAHRRLCEQYYVINDTVFREFISNKTKQQVKEIAEQTQINLAIVERNFLNFRRISEAVNEAVAAPVDPLPRLRRQFRISDHLVRVCVCGARLAPHAGRAAHRRERDSPGEALSALVVHRVRKKSWAVASVERTVDRARSFHCWNVAKKRVAHVSFLDIEHIAGARCCVSQSAALRQLEAPACQPS